MAPGVGDGQLLHHPEQDLNVEGQGQGVLVDHDQVGPSEDVKRVRAGGAPGRPGRWGAKRSSLPGHP